MGSGHFDPVTLINIIFILFYLLHMKFQFKQPLELDIDKEDLFYVEYTYNK